MYATRVTVRLAEGMQEQAREGLRNQVLPRVQAAPGFVAGYWFAPDGDLGSSVVFWETQQAAEAAAGQLQPAAHPGHEQILSPRRSRSSRSRSSRSSKTSKAEIHQLPDEV